MQFGQVLDLHLLELSIGLCLGQALPERGLELCQGGHVEPKLLDHLERFVACPVACPVECPVERPVDGTVER